MTYEIDEKWADMMELKGIMKKNPIALDIKPLVGKQVNVSTLQLPPRPSVALAPYENIVLGAIRNICFFL